MEKQILISIGRESGSGGLAIVDPSFAKSSRSPDKGSLSG